MPLYYLDIETYSPEEKPNFETDKIITIQYQLIDDRTGKPVGSLTILKEWESSEKQIIEQFQKSTGINLNRWNCMPVGFNLSFEHKMLSKRSQQYQLRTIDIILDQPYIDLMPLAVLMNNCKFKGAGLDKLTGKPHDGKIIPEWYKQKDYEKIENYIKIETEEFLKLFNWCYTELPQCLERFQKENNIKK